MKIQRIASFIILSAALAARGAYAFDITLAAAGAGSTETTHALYPTLEARVSHEGSNFGFVWDIAADGSGDYGSLFGGADGYTTVLIKEGGVTWKGGPLSLALGKLALRDEVDSPYSLALSGKGNDALTGMFRYEDDRFFFSDTWFALNYDSAGTFIDGNGSNKDRFGAAISGSITIAWPDRSSVIKSYGIKAGDLRLGFQDIIIYTDLNYGSKQRGPLFDLEYFINPVPGFLTQYALTRMDSPWEKDSALNDNSLMGFFGTWKSGIYSADAQILVDDFNMNRYLHPNSSQNPDKLAWTVGGSIETDYGTFRFDHAGATKYTFTSSGYGGQDNLAYGYTFYPDTEFLMGGAYTQIDPESNYVGYLHGENNLAFMGSWANKFGQLSASANLELTISGSKSPANPWGPDSESPSGTKLLNDPVLEKKLVVGASAEYAWSSFKLFATGKVGYVWNRLELASVGEVDHSLNNGLELYKPSSENALIGCLTLGGSWSLVY